MQFHVRKPRLIAASLSKATNKQPPSIRMPLDQVEVNVSPVSDSDTTLFRGEMAESYRKFEVSLRIHMQEELRWNLQVIFLKEMK